MKRGLRRAAEALDVRWIAEVGMVGFYWFWVWIVPALGAALLAAPVALGLVPAHPAWQWVLPAFAAVLWFLAGRLGMRVVLRTKALPRAWLAPTVTNAFMVALWTVTSERHFLGLAASLVGMLSISLGMWAATHDHRVPVASGTT